jgi:hypothetical protein
MSGVAGGGREGGITIMGCGVIVSASGGSGGSGCTEREEIVWK